MIPTSIAMTVMMTTGTTTAEVMGPAQSPEEKLDTCFFDFLSFLKDLPRLFLDILGFLNFPWIFLDFAFLLWDFLGKYSLSWLMLCLQALCSLLRRTVIEA